eukprot:6820626-Alexandrium_andersonii.AAC.1
MLKGRQEVRARAREEPPGPLQQLLSDRQPRPRVARGASRDKRQERGGKGSDPKRADGRYYRGRNGTELCF